MIHMEKGRILYEGTTPQILSDITTLLVTLKNDGVITDAEIDKVCELSHRSYESLMEEAGLTKEALKLFSISPKEFDQIIDDAEKGNMAAIDMLNLIMAEKKRQNER